MRGIYKSLILVAACGAALAACGGNESSSTSQAVSSQSKQLQRSDKSVAADYQTAVQELYVSYFGRPADPIGLSNFEAALLASNAPPDIQSLNTAYGTNSAVKALIDSFGTSAESAALYGSGGNATQFVTAIYQNVLGRTPVPGDTGAAFWVNAINNGALTLGNASLSIMAAALINISPQGLLDGQLITNRLTVASYFTSQVSGQNAVNAYSGNAAALSARTMLSGVTATPNTSAYDTATNAAIAALVAVANINVQAIIVDAGPANIPAGLDELFTSVTICAPANPTLCQTIDHVLVDTGSYGLRLISSALTPAVASALSAQITGSNTLVECTMFADGYSWGPVRSVNFQIAGESVQGMPMQVIGDPNFSSPSLVPSACSATGRAENTVAAFGANGVIGVGLFQQDCGAYCVNLPSNGYYYSCSSSSCTGTSASLAQQVPNPVSLFATDNNGVIISLPAVAAGGADSAGGTMTFGVGTRGNNALGSATVFQMDTVGDFTTIFNGTWLTSSFIDSGSNGLYFPDTNIATCADGFFCPPSQLNLSATMLGTNNVRGVVNFTIANVDTALGNFPNYSVYIPVGAPNPGNSFDWGLPFFFGRNVFVVTENQTTSGGTGPFVAF